MEPKSKMLFKPMGAVFPFSDAHALIARLTVLYEDLRIEMYGIVEEEIKPLDFNSEKYRRHYFLRRAVATLVELAQTFRLIDQCPEFQSIKDNFDKRGVIQWRRTVRFYNCHEDLLQKVRNDIGGHFGYSAAKYALQTIPYSTVGKIEIVRGEGN